MRRLGSIGLVALAAAACAPAASSPRPTPAGPPPSLTVTSTEVTVRLSENAGVAPLRLDAPLERVWEALPAVYETLGIPVEVNDASTRTYGTRRYTYGRLGGKRTMDYVRCGHQGAGPSAVSSYRVRVTIVSSVGPAPDEKSVLATEVTGVAMPVDGTSTGAVRCVTTGDLERRIHSLVAEQLGGERVN